MRDGRTLRAGSAGYANQLRRERATRHAVMLWSLTLLAFCAAAQGRAVNISNTWVLPEEGFPVFYRYFRDRISWYEADAVCQFHHANLVTVDTTAQYDAVRAYLKELDISSAVWVGLIRSNPDGDFTWTDYRGLSGEGYWSSAPDAAGAPLCAAADPAADYRWEARSCGGPTVASFICELPVPQWALGTEGCMVRALPALTILYLPESASVQLTADCGLAGVKKVQCTGNVKREDLLKELSCFDYGEEDIVNNITTNAWASQSTTNDPDTTKDPLTTDDSYTVEHNSEITTLSPETTIAPNLITLDDVKIKNTVVFKTGNPLITVPITKEYINDIHNNNIQSNDIPKLLADDDLMLNEKYHRKSDENKLMQHKLMHEELARKENYETVFTQPTDHFVPPLVMARAKMSDDMTVISLEEKHAQQVAEQRLKLKNVITTPTVLETTTNFIPKSEENKITTTEGATTELKTKELSYTTASLITTKETEHTDKIEVIPKSQKYGSPKKYVLKTYDIKNNLLKTPELTTKKVSHKTSESSPETSTITKLPEMSTTVTPFISTETMKTNEDFEDPSIELKVIIKEPTANSSTFETENNTAKSDGSIAQTSTMIIEAMPTSTNQHLITTNNVEVTHEVINITIPSNSGSTEKGTTFEVTTKIPTSIMETSTVEEAKKTESLTPLQPVSNVHISVITDSPFIATSDNKDISNGKEYSVSTNDMSTTSSNIAKEKTSIAYTTNLISETTTEDIPYSSTIINILAHKNDKESTTMETTKKSVKLLNETNEYNAEDATDQFITEISNTSETEDFLSPLLSGANEPLPKPNRSRRPQTPPNRNKFNPFRILG